MKVSAKANLETVEKETTTQMCKYQCKESGIMKNKVNMTPPKEINKGLMTDPKEMEIYEASEKESE